MLCVLWYLGLMEWLISHHLPEVLPKTGIYCIAGTVWQEILTGENLADTDFSNI